MADAAYAILINEATKVTGDFFLDEEVLRSEGVEDFSHYARDPQAPLAQTISSATKSSFEYRPH